MRNTVRCLFKMRLNDPWVPSWHRAVSKMYLLKVFCKSLPSHFNVLFQTDYLDILSNIWFKAHRSAKRQLFLSRLQVESKIGAYCFQTVV